MDLEQAHFLLNFTKRNELAKSNAVQNTTSPLSSSINRLEVIETESFCQEPKQVGPAFDILWRTFLGSPHWRIQS